MEALDGVWTLRVVARGCLNNVIETCRELWEGGSKSCRLREMPAGIQDRGTSSRFPEFPEGVSESWMLD